MYLILGWHAACFLRMPLYLRTYEERRFDTSSEEHDAHLTAAAPGGRIVFHSPLLLNIFHIVVASDDDVSSEGCGDYKESARYTRY